MQRPASLCFLRLPSTFEPVSGENAVFFLGPYSIFAVSNGLTAANGGDSYSPTDPVNLTSGNPIDVLVRYVGGVLSVTLTDAAACAQAMRTGGAETPPLPEECVSGGAKTTDPVASREN